MNSSIRWFISNPVAANLLMVCILVLGFFTLPETRKELIPSISMERISINTSLPGGSVETVEASICRPIENRIYDIQGTQDLITFAYEGVCSMTMDITEGYDTKLIADEIKTRLNDDDLLPEEASTPEVEELIIRNRVAKVIISGPVGYSVLTSTARQIRNGLLESPDITSIDLDDMESSEIRISIPGFTLEKYNISFDEIASVIRQQSGYLPGGLLQTNEGDVLITSDATRDSTESFSELTIINDGQGGEIKLGDLATIVDNRYYNETQARFDDVSAVSIEIFRVGEQNITDISKILRAYLDRYAPPENVKLYIWQDDAKGFESRVDLLVDNAFFGLALLFAVLLLFLSIRLSFWVSLGIPVAFLGSFFVIPWFDVSINFISLFAFILVLGIVVDDAVVVGESVHAENEKGILGKKGALIGVLNVYKPILFAVITTIIAFIPLLILPGPEGKMMRAIPVVVISTLIFSLVESLWILPAHLSGTQSLHQAKNKWLNRLQNTFSNLMDVLLIRIYKPFLASCLHYKGVVVIAFTITFILFILLLSFGWVKTVLLATIEGDVVVANIRFPEGTPREKTIKGLQKLELAAEQIKAEYKTQGIDAIQHVYTIVGPRNKFNSYDDGRSRDHLGQVLLELAPPETRQFSGQDILSRWRAITGNIPDTMSLDYRASLNPVNPDIEIELSGQNLLHLETLSKQLMEHLKTYDGIYDIRMSQEEQKQEAKITLKDNANTLGLTLENVIRQVNRAFEGHIVQRVQTDDDEVEVWLGLPEHERSSPWYLENLHIEFAPDQYANLSTIADVEYRPSKVHIKRYDRKRIISVTAFVDPKVNMVSRVQSDLRLNYLDELVATTPGVSWDVGGYQRAVEFFLEILIKYYFLAILAMYLLMAILFSSYVQPLIVLYAIPFGLLGSVIGHLWLGLEMTIWSFVGMVAVSGVVVNDNLVLMDYINRKRDEGVAVFNAVMEAGHVRFRPIILTSLTTFAGVIPLISETSVQAQFLIPMAVSLGFGVIFATLISLLLVPATYLIMVECQEFIQKLVTPKQTLATDDPVEVAYNLGFEQGSKSNKILESPYLDEVLSSSWEAGYSDARKA